MNDILLTFGGAAKALGDGKFRVPMVVFGGDGDLSALKDRFTKNTDFEVPEWPAPCTLRFEHGQNEFIGTKAIGGGVNGCKMYRSDDGIFVEGVLNLADNYESRIYKMIEDRKLGGSSGTVFHLIERKSLADGGHEITKWPLGPDMSLTPRPADPRTRFHELKSIAEYGQAMKSLAGETFVQVEDVMKALPIAERTRVWNSSKAMKRVKQWAAKDAKKYSRAFLSEDGKMAIADIINGELTIVPRAVIAAAAKFESIPDAAKEAAKEKLISLYAQMKMESPFGEKRLPTIEEFAAKSQFFGDMDEALSMAALSCLNSQFFYGIVYDIVFDQATGRAEKIASLQAALDEYKTYIEIVLTGLLDEAEGTPDDDMKSLREFWSNPKEFYGMDLRAQTKSIQTGSDLALLGWEQLIAKYEASAKAGATLSKSNSDSLLKSYKHNKAAGSHMEELMDRAGIDYSEPGEPSTESDDDKKMLAEKDLANMKFALLQAEHVLITT